MIVQVPSTPRLSRWIGAPCQGNSYGTEAVRALIKAWVKAGVKACLRSLEREVFGASGEARR